MQSAIEKVKHKAWEWLVLSAIYLINNNNLADSFRRFRVMAIVTRPDGWLGLFFQTSNFNRKIIIDGHQIEESRILLAKSDQSR
ncbi:MAG: hypothetical protein AAFZ92_00655 [Pseudomonadota bacterium]